MPAPQQPLLVEMAEMGLAEPVAEEVEWGRWMTTPPPRRWNRLPIRDGKEVEVPLAHHGKLVREWVRWR